MLYKASQTTLTIAALICIFLTSPGDIGVVVDHNARNAENKEFKFKSVPAPVKDDAAAKAKLILVDGETS